MKYKGTFSITYGEYCKCNSIENPTDDIIKKWINDVIENYSEGAPVRLIMDLFNIPNEYKKNIESHKFKITEEDHIVDNANKILSINMELELIK